METSNEHIALEAALGSEAILEAKVASPVNEVAEDGPLGGASDLITPLNVRDPTALIMAPMQVLQCPPSAISEPTLVEPEITPKKLKEGRLLELLKKKGSKSVAPNKF